MQHYKEKGRSLYFLSTEVLQSRMSLDAGCLPDGDEARHPSLAERGQPPVALHDAALAHLP